MANPNPFVGVIYHWIGGLSSASFYVPYKKIKLWSWEVFWITGGLFSWLFAPWIAAFAQTENLLDVLAATPTSVLGWCYFWGAMWGMGGLTFGLTMRYLGLSLGMAVALGLTTVIGTMGPPIFHGTLGELASTTSGMMTFLGIAVTLVGIIVVALAGKQREHELGQDDNSEFDLKKGILIAVFSGVMSGCFAWGLDAGQAIRDLTLAQGTDPLSQGLPVLCVVLSGGLTTNLIWCGILIYRNKSLPELTGKLSDGTKLDTQTLVMNYALAGLGGVIWYLQFFFYTMGESQMGKYGFSSWTLHMASIILFSTLWGFALAEWRGVSTSARRKVWLGIFLLVGSTVIIGLGNWLAG